MQGSSERCKVVAYRRTSSTFFTVTNRLDVASNYHSLTLEVHTGVETFRVHNIYHDAHTTEAGNGANCPPREISTCSLNHITNIEIDPLVPMVIGGDFNTHARAWSPPDIRQSTWAIDIKEWAIAQGLDLLNTPGHPMRHGDRHQRDMTIDLIWVNEAAILDDTFQDLKLDFEASLSSDHAGLWLTHHLLQMIDHSPPNWLPPYCWISGAIMCKHDCHSTSHCPIAHMSCVSFMSHLYLSDLLILLIQLY